MTNQATDFKLVTGQRWELKFNGIPSTQIRSALKARGYRWAPQEGVWYGRPDADLTDHVQKLLDKEAGVKRPDAPCWVCGNPDGFFRPRGAAAPVWCDGCDAKAS